MYLLFSDEATSKDYRFPFERTTPPEVGTFLEEKYVLRDQTMNIYMKVAQIIQGMRDEYAVVEVDLDESDLNENELRDYFEKVWFNNEAHMEIDAWLSSSSKKMPIR